MEGDLQSPQASSDAGKSSKIRQGGTCRLRFAERVFDVTDVLSTYIQRRLVFALGRFGRRVERVLVRVEDTNGPKGGIDKRCRVAVVMPHSTTAVMEGRASNIRCGH